MLIFRTMKRALNYIFQTDSFARTKALKKAEKIAEGEKVLAPKHPTDRKIFEESQKDSRIREELERKDEKLIREVNKIEIKSTEVPQDLSGFKFVSQREDHATMTEDEFGFLEPPLDKIRPNYLTFREALEILRARVEVEYDKDFKKDDEKVNAAKCLLESHPAIKRVEEKRMDLIWKYFRPFVRQDQQRVISKRNAMELERIIQAKTDDMCLLVDPKDIIRELLRTKIGKSRTLEEERFQELDAEEQERMIEAIQMRRKIEYERLEKRLKELKTTESALRLENPPKKGE